MLVKTFEYDDVTYTVRDKVGGDVIKAPRVHIRILSAIYGPETLANDERIAWEMVFIVRDVLLRVRVNEHIKDEKVRSVLPDVSDITATSDDIKAVWEAIELSPVPFIELLQDALSDDADPNVTSTPID